MARGQIARLPESVINQIAAGEVVERPASVVKELVENAIDAGATHVSVEFDGGGKERLRVLDNGRGMTPEEAILALERHATSKLAVVEDLLGILTFGFRGEALPSIASVARMTLTTRARGDASSLSASQLVLDGGTLVDEREVGAPVGTSVLIEDLFFNVPARRKFLKGETTEASHITDTVQKMALANPHVHLRLKHGNRTTLDVPLHKSRAERVHAVLGARLAKSLVHGQGEYAGVRVEVFLAEPNLAQSTTRGVQLFVAQRPVRDRGLLHAILQGYEDRMPRGRYPVAVVFVDLPDAELDVNVHPQKLEVRFADPQLVYAAVRQTVRGAVAESTWPRGEGAAEWVSLPSIASKVSPAARASELATDYARERARLLLPWARSRAAAEDARVPISRSGEPRITSAVPPQVAKQPEPPLVRALEGRAFEAADPDALRSGFFGELRYLGQLDKTYLLCEAQGELVLLDQHSASERVALENLLLQYRERNLPVQRLLFPVTVELSAQQAAAADHHGAELAAIGFELDEFGDAGGALTYSLRAVPAGLRESDPGRVAVRLLDDLSRQGGRASEDRVTGMLSTLACHSVVRAGESLSPREVQSLLGAMDQVDFRGDMPHGRPVLLRIRVGDIARRFGR